MGGLAADGAGQVVQYLVLLVIAIILSATVFGAVGPLIGEQGEVTRALSLSGGETTIPDYDFANLSVNQSLGTALRLSGGTETAEATGIDYGGTFDSGTWSLCSFARLNGSTSETVTLTNADGRATLQYNGTAGEWAGLYYNASDREDYDVGLAASSPTEWTLLCLQQANSTLTLYANGTNASVPLDGSHTLSVSSYNSSTLDGHVDETRVFNESLTPGQRDAIRATPTRPLAGVTPAVRVMYDVRGLSSTSAPIYFGGGTLELTGAGFEDGLVAEAVAKGTDYSVSGTSITPTSSKLEGAPVVFVSYDSRSGPFRGLFVRLQNLGATAFVFLALAVLAVGGRLMRSFRGGY